MGADWWTHLGIQLCNQNNMIYYATVINHRINIAFRLNRETSKRCLCLSSISVLWNAADKYSKESNVILYYGDLQRKFLLILLPNRLSIINKSHKKRCWKNPQSALNILVKAHSEKRMLSLFYRQFCLFFSTRMHYLSV